MRLLSVLMESDAIARKSSTIHRFKSRGSCVGSIVRTSVGFIVGSVDVSIVGISEGNTDGIAVGFCVTGDIDGMCVGSIV